MPNDITDLRATIVPKSDQLNSEQLLGAPRVITVTGVRMSGTSEQPIIIDYQGDAGRPYKPSKTQRKVLIFAWGEDGNAWIGRSMQLWCDPSIKFGGEAVGGIRISHLSHIAKPIMVALTETKGKKMPHRIEVLELAEEPPPISEQAVREAILALETVAADGREAFSTAWKALPGPLKAQIGIPERDRIAKLASAASISTPATTEGS